MSLTRPLTLAIALIALACSAAIANAEGMADYTRVPDTFSCNTLGFVIQKTPMHNAFGAEINIIDLSDIRELSRTDTKLQCAGTAMLSNGEVDAPMEFSLFYRANTATKWFFDVRQVVSDD